MEKLTKFIKENKLIFSGTGSGLNGNLTILCGYADFVGVTEKKDVQDAIASIEPKSTVTTEFYDELEKVFNFSYKYNYGNWWKNPEAKKQYKF